jgi:biofilm protein TabA
MILDLLSNHQAYLALHPRFPTAFSWLVRQDWASVADGRLAIDGDDVFAIVESGTTAAPSTRRFESHRRYLDIQLVISGGERMGWCPAPAMDAGDQAGPDIWFHPEPRQSQQLVVHPGQFAIFIPGEGHKPCCLLDSDPAPFRKCVVKLSFEL